MSELTTYDSLKRQLLNLTPEALAVLRSEMHSAPKSTDRIKAASDILSKALTTQSTFNSDSPFENPALVSSLKALAAIFKVSASHLEPRNVTPTPQEASPPNESSHEEDLILAQKGNLVKRESQIKEL